MRDDSSLAAEAEVATGGVSGAVTTPPADAVDAHRSVSTLGLILIAFFWCSGGIFGIEDLVHIAPVGYVFIGVMVGAICYGLPLAMISAELACAAPYDGGLVAWVAEACGARVGAHITWWLWVSYVFDAAIYPVMATKSVPRVQLEDLARTVLVCFLLLQQHLYLLPEEEDEHEDVEVARVAISLAIVVLITLVKLGGTDYIVQASGIMFVIAMLPATIYMLVGTKEFKKASLKSWRDMDTSEEAGGLEWDDLISWIIWLFSGFASLGALAGETREPARAYPIVVAVVLPLVTLYIIWPLMVSVSLDGDRENFGAGHFDTLAKELVGDWLGNMFVVGATFSFVGLFNAQVIVCERSMASVLSKPVAALSAARPRWRVLKYLATENGTGVAPVFILFNSLMMFGLVWLPHTFLIQFSVLMMCLVTFFFMYAFVWYRVARPDLPRPLSIPCGVAGAVLATVPVLGMTGTNIYFTLAPNNSTDTIADYLNVRGDDDNGEAEVYVMVLGTLIFVLAGVIADKALGLHSMAPVETGGPGAKPDLNGHARDDGTVLNDESMPLLSQNGGSPSRVEG